MDTSMRVGSDKGINNKDLGDIGLARRKKNVWNSATKMIATTSNSKQSETKNKDFEN